MPKPPFPSTGVREGIEASFGACICNGVPLKLALCNPKSPEFPNGPPPAKGPSLKGEKEESSMKGEPPKPGLPRGDIPKGGVRLNPPVPSKLPCPNGWKTKFSSPGRGENCPGSISCIPNCPDIIFGPSPGRGEYLCGGTAEKSAATGIPGGTSIPGRGENWPGGNSMPGLGENWPGWICSGALVVIFGVIMPDGGFSMPERGENASTLFDLELELSAPADNGRGLFWNGPPLRPGTF